MNQNIKNCNGIKANLLRFALAFFDSSITHKIDSNSTQKHKI